MSQLLLTFKEGATYDDALEKVYGFDMDELNALWQGSLKSQLTPPRTTETPAVFYVSFTTPGIEEYAFSKV
jgi:hypothetical protein